MILLAYLLAASVCYGPQDRSPGIAVSVNGARVTFPVGQPMEWKGHVMVPLRGVFEQMGGQVRWDGAGQIITIIRGGSTIKMTVGESHALRNDETIVTDVKSMIRVGTCYVPLRFMAEAIDATVHWDGAARSVNITTSVANLPYRYSFNFFASIHKISPSLPSRMLVK